MNDDPVIDRVRAARHRISERCNHDPKELIAYYQERQKKHEDRLEKEAAPRPRHVTPPE